MTGPYQFRVEQHHLMLFDDRVTICIDRRFIDLSEKRQIEEREREETEKRQRRDKEESEREERGEKREERRERRE